MKTKITIDDDLARMLKQRAADSGRSFKTVVNEALRAGLEQCQTSPARRPYRIKPAALGRAAGNIDLHKALQLAGQLENEELARRQESAK